MPGHPGPLENKQMLSEEGILPSSPQHTQTHTLFVIPDFSSIWVEWALITLYFNRQVLPLSCELLGVRTISDSFLFFWTPHNAWDTEPVSRS